MLPERLSTDLTSLNADEDRPAVVIDMTVIGDGGSSRADVYLATVRNRAKLAYRRSAPGSRVHGAAAGDAGRRGWPRTTTCGCRTPPRRR